MDPHDLYGVPLEQFTEQRNALAKQLRRDGRRDQAAEVSKLRKPSVAAWAVNQLVRTQRGQVDALVKAGDQLQKAQANLLTKQGDPGELREAVAAERAAVDELTEKARGLLNADGHELTPARLEQVSETLHAAALDHDARAQVRDGCLERELRHIGLGSPGAPAPSKPSPAGKSRRTDEPGRQPDHAGQVKAARKTEADARRRAERAHRELEAAQESCEHAARQLEAAEQQLAAARDRAGQADKELRGAERRVSRMSPRDG